MSDLTRCIRSEDKGFTLLEIIIAISIFAIVIAMLFSTFKAFIISGKEVKEDVLQNDNITNIHKRITFDLESIFILQTPRYRKPGFDSEPDIFGLVGTMETIGQNSVAFLTFSSLAHTKTGQDRRSGVARIAYYVRKNENNSLDLCRSDVLSLFSKEIKSCTDPVLFQNISGFEIVYKDKNSDEYKYWDSDSSEFGYTFPSCIDLKIFFGQKGQEQISVISVDIVPERETIE